MIPCGHQSIAQKEIDAVVETLQSSWITQGPKVKQFEQALADYCRVEHVVACSNGTSALHLACLALDIGVGDDVWTSPISFVASANCALYCGANVDFIDIDPDTRNISISALEQKLERAKQTNSLPKALVVVHFAGLSCDMEVISLLSKTYGFYVIEDAAHAIGSRYKNSYVGSCRYSDMATFSFHPVKNITCAEGGALTTKSAALASRIRQFCSHGVTRDCAKYLDQTQGPWYYEQHQLGFNYRMSDIQAALGIVQLERLDEFVAKRRQLAHIYSTRLDSLPLKLPVKINDKNDRAAWHIYVIELPDVQYRAKAYDWLSKQGIGVNVHYYPIHLQPLFRKKGFELGDFPNAENYYSRALTIPLFVDLTGEQQNKVIRILEEITLLEDKQ